MKILVVTEHRQGKWNNASFETLAAAQQIAAVTSGAVSAAVLGRGVGAFADELAGKAVLILRNPLLAPGDVHLQRRQRLAQLVVQLTRDAALLLLLRLMCGCPKLAQLLL